MKITFLGTRGYIKPKSRRHRMHTSTMIAYRGRKIMIDCGESWIGGIADLKPRAIVITHAHPDHAFGLKAGSPCPAYATTEAWKKMKNFPIQKEFPTCLSPTSQSGSKRSPVRLFRLRILCAHQHSGTGFQQARSLHSTCRCRPEC